jgi:hypothetical protein
MKFGILNTEKDAAIFIFRFLAAFTFMRSKVLEGLSAIYDAYSMADFNTVDLFLMLQLEKKHSRIDAAIARF